MAAAAAASSSATEIVGAPDTLHLEQAAAAAAAGGGHREADCGVCAICLDKIELQETALVKGCEHAYCVTCILRWASYKQTPLCPQCKHPFEFLSLHRSLDGCIHDYLFEESVCLLLRAAWFEPLIVEAHEEAPDEDELYNQYQYQYDDEDDLDEESYYYMSRSPSIRIGNRRWGDNGYIRGGRREARPRLAQNDSVDAGPSRTPKKKEAASSGSGSGSGSSRTPTKKEAAASESGSGSSRTPKKKEASASGSGSGSVSKEVAGRRAKRAQKREAADRAAAEKHLKHLQRLGLGKALEVPAAAEVGRAVNEEPLTVE